MVKKLPAKARDTGDAGSVPGSRRSPGGGHGHPLQYSCLENPMDGRASWTTKQSTAKRQTLLKSWHTLSAGALWCEFTCSLCVSLQVPGYQHLESPDFWRCLPGISLWLFFFFFNGLTVILGGFGGRWRQMHMYQSSILKLNMRTQRSIEKF